MTAPNTARSRELNDALRSCREPIAALIANGSIMLTQALAMRGEPFVSRALAAVAGFDEFSEDNDPWQEHDMAFLDVDGARIFFKVDYYDPEMRHLSADASNPEITRRVLTIGLASDY
jgi:hypothetical protein